jgi:type III secretion protein N (ATPase)
MGVTGSITAFYTVLVEGDAAADPVAEETRSLLDGHIVLSDRLAAAGHFPAIDVLASRSRVMGQVVSPAHRAAAARVAALLAKWGDIELLVEVGEYRPGADALADLAVARRDAITAFLVQQQGEVAGFDATVAALAELAR